MSVTAIIDRVFPYASGWTRTGTRSILKLIEEAQDQLLDYDGHENRYIEAADNKGFPPYLLTTTGTYTYPLSSTYLSCGALFRTIGGTDYTVRAKKCLRVFRDVSKGDYGTGRYTGKTFFYVNPSSYSVHTDRIAMVKVEVNSYQALENTVARVEFLEDPGTTTTTFFVEFTWEAPRLASESIPLCIPLGYERALEVYAMGRIQRFSNGQPNAYEAEFENLWKPRFRSEVLTGGANQNSRETQPRTC